MLLFLDCCCFNRPFDDLSQIRVRLEAEAVEWILEEARGGRFTLVTSDYLLLELLRNPDHVKRDNTIAMTQYAALHIPAADALRDRAMRIEELGFTPFDALHIASAESAKCSFLVTTDDRLLKKSQRHQSHLMVSIVSPIEVTTLP